MQVNHSYSQKARFRNRATRSSFSKVWSIKMFGYCFQILRKGKCHEHDAVPDHKDRLSPDGYMPLSEMFRTDTDEFEKALNETFEEMPQSHEGEQSQNPSFHTRKKF